MIDYPRLGFPQRMLPHGPVRECLSPNILHSIFSALSKSKWIASRDKKKERERNSYCHVPEDACTGRKRRELPRRATCRNRSAEKLSRINSIPSVNCNYFLPAQLDRWWREIEQLPPECFSLHTHKKTRSQTLSQPFHNSGPITCMWRSYKGRTESEPEVHLKGLDI